VSTYETWRHNPEEYQLHNSKSLIFVLCVDHQKLFG
jgi:hypothetical protein